MFAPRVVKAKSAKTERSAVASRVCVVSPEAGAHDSDENAACMTNSEAAPSWDLSKISIISFSNQERPQIPDQFPGARPTAPYRQSSVPAPSMTRSSMRQNASRTR
jgi:hypothetical protein